MGKREYKKRCANKGAYMEMWVEGAKDNVKWRGGQVNHSMQKNGKKETVAFNKYASIRKKNKHRG